MFYLRPTNERLGSGYYRTIYHVVSSVQGSAMQQKHDQKDNKNDYGPNIFKAFSIFSQLCSSKALKDIDFFTA